MDRIQSVGFLFSPKNIYKNSQWNVSSPDSQIGRPLAARLYNYINIDENSAFVRLTVQVDTRNLSCMFKNSRQKLLAMIRIFSCYDLKIQKGSWESEKIERL